MVRYVKTEALLSAFVEAGQASKRYKLGDFWELNGAEIREVMDSIPAADVEEVQHGKWVNGKCSICGEHAPFWMMASTYHESNYCPNCGAKMK